MKRRTKRTANNGPALIPVTALEHLYRVFFMIAFLTASGGYLWSQVDTMPGRKLEDLSLKELLDMKIVSVSKNTEFLFDAPLSASVLSKEEIRRSGSTSIMQALRLIPGLIVKEQSNGNYDIHLRGLENMPPNTPFTQSASTTLVMIDNRPVYSYFRGGTFWETLPVDLNDVEKIEVVRGPAAALYGPNAVNGVINIITRRPLNEGLYAVANAQQGSAHSFVNNASLGYKKEKWSAVLSGNYQTRHRSQTSYYELYSNKWLSLDSQLRKFNGDPAGNIKGMYPDEHLAMEKYAGNVFINYQPAYKVDVSLRMGLQKSTAQKVFAENEVTPLATHLSNSRYVDLHANVSNLTAQASFVRGTQHIGLEEEDAYAFSTLDASLEYNFEASHFSVKPGMSYRHAVYDDLKFANPQLGKTLFNARGVITTLSGSLRTEYKALRNKFRFVGGVSSSRFNHPDKIYLAYQLAATYKLNKRNLLRVVHARAPRSSNINDTYLSKTLYRYPTGFRKFNSMTTMGSTEIELLTAQMTELGYRFNLSSGLFIDLELFETTGRNYNVLVVNEPERKVQGADTIFNIPLIFDNLPLVTRQRGLTLSVQYNKAKWQVRPFVSWQRTMLKNYSRFYNMPTADIFGSGMNLYSGMGTSQRSDLTPTVYGGAYINYAASLRWNLNVSLYYFSRHNYYHISNVVVNDGRTGVDHIGGKVLLNARIAYAPRKGVHLFCTGQNITSQTNREFFKADRVPLRLTAGINYAL